jgi:hypothetical protein
MPTITTTNSLTDFDMCLALAQGAINSQIEDAWKVWKAKRNFGDTLRIFKTKSGGQMKESQLGLEAKIAPLTVELNVPKATGSQVKVTLTMESGKVVYRDEESGEKTECPIESKWSVSFLADLEKQAVNLATLAQIDPDSAAKAKAVVERAGLDEGVFSIEYLFLELTKVELMLSDNNDIHIPASVPSGARNKALEMLSLLLRGDMGKFVMGTVVRRNAKQATPTFALTEFLFDLTPHERIANASTLNYLGMMARRPMPADSPAARSKLKGGWVRPEQVDAKESLVSGVMATSGRLFLEQYLIPKFQKALMSVEWQSVLGTAAIGRRDTYAGPAPIRNGLTWTFAEEIETSTNLPELFGELVLTLTQSYSLQVKVLPSTAPEQLAISGTVTCKVHIDGSLLKFRTQYIHVDGHQDYKGTLALTGSGIGTDFVLKSALKYEFKDPVMDKKDTGGANVLEVMGDIAKAVGLIAETPEQLLVKVQKGTGQKLMETLKQALARLDMDLNQHSFIPPGGGVFTFQNPCFSNAGDLFLDVIYRRT